MAPGRGSPRPQNVLPDKNVFIYPNTLGPTGEQETHFCCVKSPHFGVGSLTQHVIKGAAQGPRGEANRPPGGLALLHLPRPRRRRCHDCAPRPPGPLYSRGLPPQQQPQRGPQAGGAGQGLAEEEDAAAQRLLRVRAALLASAANEESVRFYKCGFIPST